MRPTNSGSLQLIGAAKRPWRVLERVTLIAKTTVHLLRLCLSPLFRGSYNGKLRTVPPFRRYARTARRSLRDRNNRDCNAKNVRSAAWLTFKHEAQFFQGFPSPLLRFSKFLFRNLTKLRRQTSIPIAGSHCDRTSRELVHPAPRTGLSSRQL